MQKKEYSCEIGGKKLTATFSDLTDQANGSVIIKYGETNVLATAVMSGHQKEIGYFPLVVDYEERFYAAGQILGGRFIRREGRPSEEAILTGRVIDRTIRPLFDHSIRNEIQLVITVLAIDKENDSDIPAIIASSLALAVSDIPWNGPIGAVRIGQTDEKLTVNPVYSEREKSTLDAIICGKDKMINMVEAGATEIKEEEVDKAFALAEEEIQKIIDFQTKIIKEIGKEKQTVSLQKELSTEMVKLFKESVGDKLNMSIFSGPGKKEIGVLKEGWMTAFAEAFPDEKKGLADDYFEEIINETIHTEAIENNKRADGRAMDELREINAEVGGISKMLHGTGIFYRGGTHVLSVLTLGGPRDTQLIEGMEIQTEKRFMHHYNFPPFSVGETGRVGGMNRRAIGHGALAERALEVVLPPKEDFPYTIRIVSESMASNGSTSMGSVCGSTLALMDAGVPIKNPVAGIAMGLMIEQSQISNLKSQKYKILTDIQGPEDHHGDMDFKVAGTEDGVTAIQMDVKVNGIPAKILSEALIKAKEARLQIIEKIKEAIPEPRKEISIFAPKIISIKIEQEQIGMVIGPGGKMVKSIREDTGAEIDIEEDGTIYITGVNDSAEEARAIIETITHEYKAGEKFENAEVVKVLDFGAFVKIGPNTDGLVHISEIAPFRIDNVEDVLKEGDIVSVVIKEIGERDKISLSIKDIDPDYAENHGAKPSQNNNGNGKTFNNKPRR